MLVDDDPPPPPSTAEVSLPLLVAADQNGARIAAVLERRPPLVLSDDAGQTWRESGGGLPAGVAVAIDPDDPDRILFASESRIFLSRGRRPVLARASPPELIGITALAFS